MAEHMIGVDIGTTSTKAVVYTLDGAVAAHHAVNYPLLRPTPAAAEQDPQQICAAVIEAIRTSASQCPGGSPRPVCVAFSAAMHSLIAVDGHGQPLTNSITWADNRAAAWAQRLKSQPGSQALYRRTGTPLHAMSPLAKLAWLHDEHPALCAQAARFVGIKEYVFYQLFGAWLVDHSIASATGLFNLHTLDWDEPALALAGVQRAQLSAPVPTTHVVQGLRPAMAERLGIAAATPFVIGANDGALSNLGVNAIAPGEVAVTIGTSGAMRAVVDRPLTDPASRTFCYALTPRHWVVGGPVNNGGIVLRWVRDELAAPECEAATSAGLDPYDLLMRIAERVEAGAQGLVFHPYLAGERAPLWNSDLRGSFFGLAVHHRKPHMIRAVLEGVVFNLCSILPAVESLVGPSTRIKATGGFARSALWRQIMADVFDREVVVPESFESSCLGAAVLGLYALGRVDSLDAVGPMVGAVHRHVPLAGNVAIYQELMPIFLALPRLLGPQYRQIVAFQERHAAPPAVSG